VADDVLVMYAGRSIEQGSAAQVLRSPQHPYTWGLLGSVPSLHGKAGDALVPISGNPPSLIQLPGGCAFHPRCRYAGSNGQRSFLEVPELRDGGESDHLVACHLSEQDRAVFYERDIVRVTS
jgi:peptide/nickel transport system ATP-binding protein